MNRNHKILIALLAAVLCLTAGFAMGRAARDRRCEICAYMRSPLTMPMLIDASTGVTNMLSFPSNGGGYIKFRGPFSIEETEEETEIWVRDPVEEINLGTVWGTKCFCAAHADMLAEHALPYGVLFREDGGVTFAPALLDRAHHMEGYYMDATMEEGGLYIYLLKESTNMRTALQ